MHFFQRLPVPRGCESWWPQRSCQLLPRALNAGSPFFPVLQPTVSPQPCCGRSRNSYASLCLLGAGSAPLGVL